MKKPSLNCLVWYKGRPALVTELGEKITIAAAMGLSDYGEGTETIKVREKDIEVLHPGPLKNLSGLIEETANDQTVRDAWELMGGGVPLTLEELAELVDGGFTPQSAWAARLFLADGLYFTGTIDAISARSAPEVSAALEKRQNKAKEGQEREAFLGRLRSNSIDAQEDGRFLQDVEALAYGQSDKSRTMKELGRTETPAEAHRLLLECGFWDKFLNPHPRRYGTTFRPGINAGASGLHGNSPASSSLELTASQSLQRRDLTHLKSFAIDSPWSSDPDDALSLEPNDGMHILYVHVADPASIISNGSPLDLCAREKGATLYLPEGTMSMLGEEALSRFALGLKGAADEALSFKITLGGNCSIEDIEIFPSVIKVTRLSYEEADTLIESAMERTGEDTAHNAAILGDLIKFAEANLERRLNAGGVNIELPEAHILVNNKKITIDPIVPRRSAGMVRECMLLAGEGAALWASRRQLPFPYITQETGDLPTKPLSGFAGSCQLRRCMRPRAVSAKPGYHWGLGLDCYSQVTSPLRRYTDLLAHQQIRACLGSEAGITAPGNEPLNEEALLFSLAAADAAAQSAVHAERASKLHWVAVYLDGMLAANPGGELMWDAVVTEKRANSFGIIIPDLGLETQVGGTFNLNDTIKVRLISVRVPELEMNFVSV